MLSGPTSHVETVDSVMLFIVIVSAILLLGITATMIYFVVKYNRKKNKTPKDIHSNLLLEIIWIAIPTIIVLVMFYYGYRGYEDLKIIPDNAFNVEVTAKMWDWDFKYENGYNKDSLYIPQGREILLIMESLDVNHSLFVPAFRVKQDVVAGRKTYLTFTADKLGSYDIACAEYCGLNHSMMYSKVVVLDTTSFNKWYSNNNEIK